MVFVDDRDDVEIVFGCMGERFLVRHQFIACTCNDGDPLTKTGIRCQIPGIIHQVQFSSGTKHLQH